jgi:hypothetical protein
MLKKPATTIKNIKMTTYLMKKILIRFLFFIRKSVSSPAVTFRPVQKTPLFLCCSMLFLAGCAPGSLLIREADLTDMDQRLSEQALLTAHIIELQQTNQEILIRLAEKAEDDKGCEHMIPLLEKILESQAVNLMLLEEIPKKFAAPADLEAPFSPPPSAPPRTMETMGSQKTVVGAVEKVRITPPGLAFMALMDTGAETSSLDARNIERFERDGERWVRFDILHPETGELVPMEQKLLRKTRILKAISDEFERRLVVELSFSYGDITQIAEFTLSDRSHLRYPILIGHYKDAYGDEQNQPEHTLLIQWQVVHA